MSLNAQEERDGAERRAPFFLKMFEHPSCAARRAWLQRDELDDLARQVELPAGAPCGESRAAQGQAGLSYEGQ